MDSGTQQHLSTATNFRTGGNSGTGYLFWPSETQLNSKKVLEELSHSPMDCDAVIETSETAFMSALASTDPEVKEQSQPLNVDEKKLLVVDVKQELTPNLQSAPMNETLTEPQVPVNPGVQTCRFCKNKFSSFSLLKSHLESVHPVQLANSKQYNLNVSGLETYLMDFKERRLHLRYAHPAEKCFHCNFCSEDFRSQKSLTNHIKWRHGYGNKLTYSCLKCDKLFPNKNKLTEHISWAHPEGAKLPTCQYCGKEFGQKENLTRHKVMCFQVTKFGHEEEIVQNLSTAIDETLTISDEVEVEMTLNLPNPVNQYSPECQPPGQQLQELTDGLSKNNLILESHFDHKISDSGKIYQCKVCGDETNFISPSEACQHMRDAHPRKKPLICKFCNNGYFKGHELSSHGRERHPEKLLLCKLCYQTCLNTKQMNRHIIQAHKGETAKLVPTCNICGKNFTTSQKLNLHMKRFHADFSALTVEKRFDCGSCGRRFFKSKNLFRHIETEHSENVDEESNKLRAVEMRKACME